MYHLHFNIAGHQGRDASANGQNVGADGQDRHRHGAGVGRLVQLNASDQARSGNAQAVRQGLSEVGDSDSEQCSVIGSQGGLQLVEPLWGGELQILPTGHALNRSPLQNR